MPPKDKVPTPCIGICSTVFGDVVCRGCRRFVHEVIDWNRYNDDQKKLIWARLDALTVQVVGARLQVTDETLLRRMLTDTKLRLRKDAPLLALFLEVLRQGAGQIPPFEQIGLSLLPEHAGKSQQQLKEEILNELHVLASAHYEMGFQRNRPPSH